MQAGYYTLHLYCDNGSADGCFREAAYTAEKATTCRAQARRDGWSLDYDLLDHGLVVPGQKDLCPKCAKAAKAATAVKAIQTATTIVPDTDGIYPLCMCGHRHDSGHYRGEPPSETCNCGCKEYRPASHLTDGFGRLVQARE